MRGTEAKYVTITEVGKKTMWITDYMKELGKKQHKKILYRDI